MIPSVGVAVAVTDEDGDEHRSEVHAVSDEVLLLRRPAVLPTGAPLLIGAELVIAWDAGDSAVHKIRGRIVSMPTEEITRLWQVELSGESWREQRRRWPRIPASGPVQVGEVVDEDRLLPPREATGELVDLSEVACRFAVAASELWAGRRLARVRATFPAGAAQVSLTGRVLTSAPGRGDAGRQEVVLQFDSEPDATQQAALSVLREYLASQGRG